jgi:hypothetical protein
MKRHYSAIHLLPRGPELANTVSVPDDFGEPSCDEPSIVDGVAYDCRTRRVGWTYVLFYTFLYSDDSVPVGIQLNNWEPETRQAFRRDTERLTYITWDGNPTVWLRDARTGRHTSTSAEMFSQLFVCSNAAGVWALVVESSLLNEVQ